ncbi:MAG: phosphotransferase [Clostridia bacterium]|nr:aminoglycoside phosphotransferase family protein [Clostridiaceae bacterium]
MHYNLDNPIAERKTKTVYKDNDKTIKLFVENYSKADILNEALNQARVEEGTTLNVPKLLEVTRIDGRWGLVSEHIEGTPLNKLMEEHPEKEEEYLNLFVDTQIKILSNSVPLLNRIKDKFRRKLSNAVNIDENTRYELMQRLEGMKNHTKLCHGDFNPSNVIIKENGEVYVIDWSHVTQGNASADAARTFLLFSIEGKSELAEKYINLFSEKSGITKANIQRWIPIVAATQMTKGKEEEQEFLSNWINVVDYE